MSHDGSPSPLYWVIWLVFQNFQTFPGFPCTTWGSSTAPGGPGRFQRDPNSFWRWSGHTWCARSYLEESGCPWVYLNSSRSFGLRHMLAGHSCRCWVGEAHGRARIEVEVVREQLGGQGILCVEVCCYMGQVVPPITHWWVVHPVSMGRVRSGWLSKFWCIPVLFWWVFGLLNGLDMTGSHLLDAQQLESSVDELQLECLQRSLVPVP